MVFLNLGSFISSVNAANVSAQGEHWSVPTLWGRLSERHNPVSERLSVSFSVGNPILDQK